MKAEPTERLQKVLAHAGVASRRAAEALIQEGRVTVNGRIVTELGAKVDPARDEIRVDGRRVRAAVQHVYVVLHKPRGVLSVMRDPRGRRALGDLIDLPERLYPVGRLDAESTGLILLTDDGELANLLTHPRYGQEKEYEVLVHGAPSEETLAAWRRGIVVEGEKTAPAGVTVLRQERDATLLRVVMHEGRKRQIRNVAKVLGHPVRELTRVRLGPLRLGTLKPGEWRSLTEREMEEIREIKARGALPGAQGALHKRRGAGRGSQAAASGGSSAESEKSTEAHARKRKRGGARAPTTRREKPRDRAPADGTREQPSGRRERTGSRPSMGRRARGDVSAPVQGRGRRGNKDSRKRAEGRGGQSVDDRD